MVEVPQHPNLVFILPDRQRRDTLACYGNDWIQVPHLNGLAEESFVFDHCYVTQAVCCPARASIMSGLYPIDAGMPVNLRVLPDNVRTIAEMLSSTNFPPTITGLSRTASSRTRITLVGRCFPNFRTLYQGNGGGVGGAAARSGQLGGYGYHCEGLRVLVDDFGLIRL